MMIPIPTIQPFKSQRLLVKLKLTVGKDAVEVLGYFRIKHRHLFLVSKVHFLKKYSFKFENNKKVVLG